MNIKKLCILTMIGGIDVMGDLLVEDAPAFAMIEHPVILQFQPPAKTVFINNFLRGSRTLAGTHIMINMRTVLWMSEPSQELAAAYKAQRAGLTFTAPHGVGVNQ